MALFDNDFIETIVTEGKDCDKDCKKGKDVEDEKEEKEDEDVKDEDVEDADEELSDEDKEEAEESARFDVEEASSIESMKGIEHPVYEMASDAHFACLEFIGTTIALDKVDVACTESYVKAVTEAEKEAVTARFKESVKKYAQKFKAFIIKIKNMIVRAYNRVKNYIVNFITKVGQKVASFKIKELDTTKLNAATNKMKVYEAATKGSLAAVWAKAVSELKAKIAYEGIANSVIALGNDASDEEIANVRDKINEVAGKSKEDIRKQVLGEQKEVTPATFASALSDLNGLKVPSQVDETRKDILKLIDNVEKSVLKNKDLNSKIMSVKVTFVNKMVTVLNKIWAVLGTLMHHWISPRVSVVMSYGVRQWKSEKKEANKESWTMLDSFEAEW